MTLTRSNAACAQALLLQTLAAFKELLAATPEAAPPTANGSGEGDAAVEPSADAAWRSFALYSLRSFLRKYFLQLAPLAAQLQGELFAEGATAADVREAAVLSLRL